MIYFYIFLGGGIGASARYLVSNTVNHWTKLPFPYGTLTVNVFGSFLIGLLLSFMEGKEVSFLHWKVLLVTGFLGGFTTFSSFSYETLQLLQKSGFRPFSLNISLNLFLCLFFVYIGNILAKIISL